MSKAKGRSSARGFSVAEVVVAMLVVSLIASVALPKISSAIGAARSQSSQAMARSLSSALAVAKQARSIDPSQPGPTLGQLASCAHPGKPLALASDGSGFCLGAGSLMPAFMDAGSSLRSTGPSSPVEALGIPMDSPLCEGSP